MTLTFIYNADASFFSQLTDYLHKTISPATYQCNLCGLTYGAMGMKKEWKEFIQKLPLQVKFLHKDEFVKQYPNLQSTTLPAAIIEKDGNILLLITSQELNKQKSITDLEKLVKFKLEQPY